MGSRARLEPAGKATSSSGSSPLPAWGWPRSQRRWQRSRMAHGMAGLSQGRVQRRPVKSCLALDVLPRDGHHPSPRLRFPSGSATPTGTAQWHWGMNQQPGLLQHWCSCGVTLMAGRCLSWGALGPSVRLCQCPGMDTPAPGASLVTPWPLPLKIIFEDQALPPRQGPSRAMGASLWPIQDGLGGDIGHILPLPMPALAVVSGEVAAPNTWGAQPQGGHG